MQFKILFITPPFTQLNTVYPASAYLKGFLESRSISVTHLDLSIELFTSIFKSEFLNILFKEAQELNDYQYPEMIKQKKTLHYKG